jgi:hypothetical protein
MINSRSPHDPSGIVAETAAGDAVAAHDALSPTA